MMQNAKCQQSLRLTMLVGINLEKQSWFRATWLLTVSPPNASRDTTQRWYLNVNVNRGGWRYLFMEKSSSGATDEWVTSQLQCWQLQVRFPPSLHLSWKWQVIVDCQNKHKHKLHQPHCVGSCVVRFFYAQEPRGSSRVLSLRSDRHLQPNYLQALLDHSRAV